MPRRRSQSETRALRLAIGSVVFAVGLLVVLLVLAGRGNVEVTGNLGDRNFEVGNAERLADRIAEDVGPQIFPDPLERDRPIFIDHAGGPADRGWIAILAVEDGCTLTYTDGGYTDCDGKRWPRDGEGLTQYRAFVDGETLVVDLRKELE